MCCCPLPSSSGRSPANGSATRSPPRRRKACGWVAMCRSAMTRASFTFRRNPARVADEARLDGFYVIRTSVENKVFAAHNLVGAYKSLARVERAFRSLKTVDLHLRPIHHWLAPRVRAHVFLCML